MLKIKQNGKMIKLEKNSWEIRRIFGILEDFWDPGDSRDFWDPGDSRDFFFENFPFPGSRKSGKKGNPSWGSFPQLSAWATLETSQRWRTVSDTVPI